MMYRVGCAEQGRRSTISKTVSSIGRRIRVIRLIPVLDFGGVETTFVLEAARIDRAAIDLSVCTFWKEGSAAERIRALGIPVTSLGIDPSIRNPRATLALAKHVRQVRPDILHASIGEANFHAALIGKPLRVPTTIMEEQGLPSRNMTGRLVHAALYRMVDAVVGVSRASCAYLTEREWAPRDRVHLLYNAVTDQFLEPLSPRRTPDGLFRFLTVGRLVEVKNHAALIRAFAEVAHQAPQVRLTIAGDGPLMERLRVLVGELKLDGKVSLPGFTGQVRALLDSADSFVLPSLSEGFGIAAVEAMARGLPVIVSDAGALPEVAGSSEWVVPATDVTGWGRAMLRMASLDDAAIATLRARARSIAEGFSAARHIAGLEALYRQLIFGRYEAGEKK